MDYNKTTLNDFYGGNRKISIPPEEFIIELDKIGEKDLDAILLKLTISSYMHDNPGQKMCINLKSPRRTWKSIKAETFFFIKLAARYSDFTITAEGNLDAAGTLLLMCAPDGNRLAKEGTLYSLVVDFPDKDAETLANYSPGYLTTGLLGRTLNPKFFRDISSFGNEEALKLGIINKVV